MSGASSSWCRTCDGEPRPSGRPGGPGPPAPLGHPRGAGPQPGRHHPRQHRAQRDAAHPHRPRAGPGRLAQPGGMGAQRLHPGLRGDAVHLGSAGRPTGPQAGTPAGPRPVRTVVPGRGLRRVAGAAHRRPCLHGGERRGGAAEHTRHHRRRLPAARAAQGPRDLGGLGRLRPRHRARHRRDTARALLVGLGPAGQRAPHGRVPGRGGAGGARDPGTAGRRVDAAGLLLSIAGVVPLVYAIIEAGRSGGVTRPAVWAAGLAGLGLLLVFLWHERRTRNPRWSSASSG